MTDERWLDRQLPEKAGNDLIRAPLPLFLGARPHHPALEVGAPGRSGNARGGSDPSAVTPGAGDRELAAMPEPRELRREIPLAQSETRAERTRVGEHAPESRRQTGHAPEYRLDDAMVIEQIRLIRRAGCLPG
jgi:hypothetical protein